MLAIGLGAILLSIGALARLTAAFAYVAGAAVAWKQVKPLLEAARRPEDTGHAEFVPSISGRRHRLGPLVVAKDLAFQFRDRAQSALHECSFRISHGDRIISPDHREAGSRRSSRC